MAFFVSMSKSEAMLLMKFRTCPFAIPQVKLSGMWRMNLGQVSVASSVGPIVERMLLGNDILLR